MGKNLLTPVEHDENLIRAYVDFETPEGYLREGMEEVFFDTLRKLGEAYLANNKD